MKNAVFRDVTPCGSCKNRRFGRSTASVTRVEGIGELGTTLAVTSSVLQFVVTVNVASVASYC
jgi:hypothetical protein